MKKYINIIMMLVLSLALNAQPNMDVSMVRGLGNQCDWDIARAELLANPGFTALFSLGTTGTSNQNIFNHNINYERANNTVVAHSMGGLVARGEMFQGDDIDHLITIGTPHLGAPIAAMGTNMGILLPIWIEDLLAGPCTEFGGAWCLAGNNLIQQLLINVLPGVIEASTPLGRPATNDMIPGSNFMNTINNDFAASMTPNLADSRFIFAREDFQDFYRLASSTTTDCSPENGVLASGTIGLGVTYLIIAMFRQFDASSAMNNFLQTGDFWWLIQANQLRALSSSWLRGAQSLISLQQAEWSTYVDGSRFPNGNWWASDGVVPVFSQVAFNLMPPQFIAVNFAGGVNHNEETQHPNAIQAIRETLIELNIN